MGLSVLGPKDGGSRTSELQAMGANGTLFAIVDATSQGTASAQWKLWRKSRSGKTEDRTEVTSHAALDLWRAPNPYMTGQELVESGQQHSDLTGETWLVVSRASGRSSLPLELWPVRPDKMAPVPHPRDFLSGYVYRGPDGEEVPLKKEDVIFMRRPHPMDPYRGCGPIQSVLTDIDSAKYSSEWNRAFFKNSAEPGGIIKVDRKLTDVEFNDLVSRWKQSHQGVANAHRVAVLEQGEWIERKYTQRDMQFVELRKVSSELIREAFRFPVSMLGTSENVNRANAEAAEVVFGRWLIIPRLDRWKGALNNDLLPMFYPAGTPRDKIDLEFDYERDSVVPADEQGEAVQLTARSSAAVTLIGAGFDPEQVLDVVKLPAMDFKAPEPPPAPPSPPATDPGDGNDPGEGDEGGQNDPSAPGAPGEGGGSGSTDRGPKRIELAWPTDHRGNGVFLNADDMPEVDLGKHQEQWESALEKVLKGWGDIKAGWKTDLLTQIKEMAATGSLTDLLRLGVATDAGEILLEDAMQALGQEAAEGVVEEARKQGVKTHPVYPRKSEMSVLAKVTIAQLGQEMSLSAAREAVRISGTKVSAQDVVDGVEKHIDLLTDAQPRLRVAGALSGAQNTGRIGTLAAAPVAAYYATEVLDKNTCKFCRAVNGRWLGNDLNTAQKLYPRAGYVDCEGRDRCRGTIVAVWRPEQSNDF